MKQSDEIQTISAIYCRVERTYEVQMEEWLGVKALASVILNFYNDGIEEYGYLVVALDRNEYRSKQRN